MSAKNFDTINSDKRMFPSIFFLQLFVFSVGLVFFSNSCLLFKIEHLSLIFQFTRLRSDNKNENGCCSDTFNWHSDRAKRRARNRKRYAYNIPKGTANNIQHTHIHTDVSASYLSLFIRECHSIIDFVSCKARTLTYKSHAYSKNNNKKWRQSIASAIAVLHHFA